MHSVSGSWEWWAKCHAQRNARVQWSPNPAACNNLQRRSKLPLEPEAAVASATTPATKRFVRAGVQGTANATPAAAHGQYAIVRLTYFFLWFIL